MTPYNFGVFWFDTFCTRTHIMSFLVWLGEEMDHFAASGLYPWDFKSRLAAYAYRFIILMFQAQQISAQTDH